MATPNTLFAIMNVFDAPNFQERLGGAVPWIHLKVTDADWLLYVPASTTAKEVSDRLGLSGTGGSGIVLKVESYFGTHYQTTWDWIRAKQGAELVAIHA